jgi:signal transduction histidine kinase
LPYAKPSDYGEDWQASGILHDFNNLLAIILSHTNIALSKVSSDSPLRPNLERAMRATRRAADLSNQLALNLSRRQDEVAFCEPNVVVQEVIDLLEPKIAAKAELEQHLADDLFAIAVPRLRLQQVLMNLVLNAVEAIQAPPGLITIVTTNRFLEAQGPSRLGHPEFPTGQYVMLQVGDTGIGMNQAMLNNIFEPYFTTKATGTGVGLSTTVGIVHTYQGIMQVTSTLGVGSTFRIFFPALE